MTDLRCPECEEKTDYRSGPITSDWRGTMDGAWFKCCSCSTVYNGRQARLAEAEKVSAEEVDRG